eukprot:482985-Prymnesium_polylepis.1
MSCDLFCILLSATLSAPTNLAGPDSMSNDSLQTAPEHLEQRLHSRTDAFAPTKAPGPWILVPWRDLAARGPR